MGGGGGGGEIGGVVCVSFVAVGVGGRVVMKK